LLTSADVGRWKLLAKIKDGSLPAMFSADDLSYFNFAANPLNATGTGPQPINTDADLKAFFGADHLQRYTVSWSERLVGVLTNRIVQAILVVIFLIALFAEMTHPGAVFPAVISLIALVCLIAPSALIGMALWWEIMAIFLGVMLIGVEILVLPGFGVAGITGLVLLFIGLIGLFVPGNTGPFPDSPQARDDMLRAAVTLILSFGTAGFGMYFVAKHFGSMPILGKLVLKPVGSDDDAGSMLGAMDPTDDAAPLKVGQTGTALTPMRPAGRVQVGDTVIDAVAEFGFIDPGTPVRISSVSAMRVGVEAVDRA
jgi:membrane-bound serine protease (ClpP class)